MVPRAGFEPAHPKARDFKSLVSTYSTIWGDDYYKLEEAVGFEPTIPYGMTV